MVFAPHPDDETLGCAGLIQQTVASGGSVEVVLFTNGDAFRTGVECAAHSLRVVPEDYLTYARRRQQETRAALRLLGVPAENVVFLGYPDQGLRPMWYDYWTPDRLYTSATTHCSNSPYPDSYTKNTPYCGQSVLADVEQTLRRFHPDRVTVTHPAEDHSDHAAAAAFVTRALQELRETPQEADWSRRTQLSYYLVHRGDWPVPQGRDLTAPLSPPATMAHLDTRWTALPLTQRQATLKARSIECYASQTAMMGRFLRSFARRTEIYGDMVTPSLITVTGPSLRQFADQHRWDALPPVLVDPVDDNVLRDLNGSGDIRDLYACRQGDSLLVKLDCRRAISGTLDYRLRIRCFGAQGETTARAPMFDLRPTAGATAGSGLQVTAERNTLCAAIPWARITDACQGTPVQALALDAETSLSHVPIDRTGVRLLTVPSEGSRP
jgi:LmbE family N-acetylglucosaminyl deacetylase